MVEAIVDLGQSENRLRCLARIDGGSMIVCGDLSGRLQTIALDPIAIIDRKQIHSGNITAVAFQQAGRYAACISMDKSVSISRIAENGSIHHLRNVRIRNIVPENDTQRVFQRRSNSQAIGLHDDKRRLVTRSSNAGLLEVDFDDAGRVEKRHCTRLHGLVDIITVRYLPGTDYVLSGAGDGTVALSLDGRIERLWKIGDHSIHWIEALSHNEFLVASDGRFVGKFSTESDHVVLGPEFAVDDVEQVRYCTEWDRAFASSFDRHVYGINTESCGPTAMRFEAPFKCRWFAPVPEINKLVVLSQDGAIHLVEPDTGEQLEERKTAPRALWTADRTSEDSLLFTGEGNVAYSLTRASRIGSHQSYDIATHRLPFPDSSYTKRIAIDRRSGVMHAGRTDGQVLSGRLESDFHSINLGSAVRDIAIEDSGRWIFAATEAGEVFRLSGGAQDQTPIRAVSPNKKPVWCLGFNNTTRQLLAAERYGDLFLLDENLEMISRVRHQDRYKRCKWISQNTALLSAGGKVLRYDSDSDDVSLLFDYAGNTVEDFIISRYWNYIISINYTQTVFLHDLLSGEVVDFAQDQYDTSKGICWLHDHTEDPKSLDFITFGRSGNAHRFQVYNDSLMPTGFFKFHEDSPDLRWQHEVDELASPS